MTQRCLVSLPHATVAMQSVSLIARGFASVSGEALPDKDSQGLPPL